MYWEFPLPYFGSFLHAADRYPGNPYAFSLRVPQRREPHLRVESGAGSRQIPNLTTPWSGAKTREAIDSNPDTCSLRWFLYVSRIAEPLYCKWRWVITRCHMYNTSICLWEGFSKTKQNTKGQCTYTCMCTGPTQLTSLVPPQLPPRTCPRTRSDHSVRHESQLQNVLPASSPDYVRLCFPYSIIDEWNNLPPTVLQSPPRLTSLQSFKGKVHQHLRQSRWHWAADSL